MEKDTFFYADWGDGELAEYKVGETYSIFTGTTTANVDANTFAAQLTLSAGPKITLLPIFSGAREQNRTRYRDRLYKRDTVYASVYEYDSLDLVGIDVQFLFLGRKVGKLCSLLLAPSVLFECLFGNVCNACGVFFNQAHILVIITVNGKGFAARDQKLNVTDRRKLARAVFKLDVDDRSNKLLVIAFGNDLFAVIKQLGVGYNVKVRGLVIQKTKRHGAELARLKHVIKGSNQCTDRNAFDSSLLAIFFYHCSPVKILGQ